jgi:hypothetical protein
MFLNILRISPCSLFEFRINYEIMSPFRQLVGLVGRCICPSQGLFQHMTAQQRKTRIHIRALSRILTHDTSVRDVKAHALEHASTVQYLYDYRENRYLF